MGRGGDNWHWLNMWEQYTPLCVGKDTGNEETGASPKCMNFVKFLKDIKYINIKH